MKRLNVDALRRATGGARLQDAQTLVHRTLAQHGLMPAATPDGAQAMPSLESLIAQFKGPQISPKTAPEPIPAGAQFSEDAFTCKAGSRTYRTYIPASAAQGVTGVIMMLHGCTQTPEDFAAGTGMNALAEIHRLVVIYPKQARGNNAQSCWNWFSPGDQRRDRGEPAILAGIATSVCETHGIGRDRTFVAGLSAGAAMAVILGGTYADVFAAVGAHSGLPAGAAQDVPQAFAAMAGNAPVHARQPRTNSTMRTIAFHGTADATVHPSNGDAIARHAVDAGAPQSIETHSTAKASGRNFTRTVSSDLEGKPIVEHWAIDGQGHAWSGGQPGGSYTDPKGPDASAEMIRFFFNTPDREI
jgi:poly(hydroxyalkanoate) depolymerase family esterase